MNDKRDYRIVMGERLKEFRVERGLTLYKVAQRGGIRIESAKAVEDGTTNYTIDAFLGYVQGSDLYLYFGEKSPSGDSHDFEDMARKAAENHPDN